MIYDVLVIGAGFAGLSAALHTAQSGARTEILAKGIGSTHWVAGWVDVLGYWPAGSAEPVVSPRDAVRQLIVERPEHPYGRAGIEVLDHALSAFCAHAAAGGLVYDGTLNRNVLLVTPAGVRRPTCLVPRAMAAAAGVADGKTVVVGIAGMRDFYPEYVVANLQAQGCAATPVIADMPSVRTRRPQTTVILAMMLEDRAVRDELIRGIASAARGADRVGFPAVLGVGRHREVTEDLERGLGVPVFEIPTLPPSVSGYRLFEALRRRFVELGGRITIGAEVVTRWADGDRLVGVGTEAAARTQRHSAGAFVVATGGFLGGGLVAAPDGGVRETALGLPVQAPPDRSSWFDPRVLAPQGHAVFRAGLAVNGEMQPLDARGAAVYRNVWAAGSVLAGANEWREKSHEGLALATGEQAARGVLAGWDASQRSETDVPR